MLMRDSALLRAECAGASCEAMDWRLEHGVEAVGFGGAAELGCLLVGGLGGVLVRFAGVEGAGCEGARVVVRFARLDAG